tara:strand:- start:447 stop:668 length:222 start_codon:yes stop_codon:yes gene_type:complete
MKYVIINKTEIPNIDFTQVIENNVNTLRYSLDGELVVLKYKGTQPSFLEGVTEYNYTEIMNILWTSEWSSDEL